MGSQPPTDQPFCSAQPGPADSLTPEDRYVHTVGQHFTGQDVAAVARCFQTNKNISEHLGIPHAPACSELAPHT